MAKKNIYKLTEEEINDFKSMQKSQLDLINNLGKLMRQKWAIEKAIENLQAQNEQELEKEKSIVQHLQDTYGTGALDIETWEFTKTTE
jgi:hypothetical protein